MCSKNEVLAARATSPAHRAKRDLGFLRRAARKRASRDGRMRFRLPKPRFCCTPPCAASSVGEPAIGRDGRPADGRRGLPSRRRALAGRPGPARLCQYWFNSGTVRIGAPVDRTGRCAFASLGCGLGVLQRFGAHGLAFAALGLRKRAVLLAAGAHASVEHRCRLFRFRLLLVRFLLLVFLRAHVDPFALCSRPF